jgi:multicomponent Na+:H+ antiporter subunit E
MTSPGDRHRSPTQVAAGAADPATLRGAIWRAPWFLGLWLVIAGAHIADLPAAALAVVAATWMSLRLLPPSGARFSVPGQGRVIRLFLYESVVAGVDVARRALDPRLPLRPGLVTYPIGFPPGAARNVFTILTSLLPGTVPAADEGDVLVYHCLDVEQPVLAQLAAEETTISRTFRRAGAAG